jgi:hypothetical protein
MQNKPMKDKKLGVAESLDDLPAWNVSETLTPPHEFQIFCSVSKMLTLLTHSFNQQCQKS